MMVARITMVALLGVGVTVGSGAVKGEELRPSLNRPEIIEIGGPIPVDRAVIRREMALNGELREYVGLYGWPEYAEVQEIQVQEPFAPYEVRLYYLRRNQQLAFGRVHVAPSVNDFGVRKFEGPIEPETLDRLLTARLPEPSQPEVQEPFQVSYLPDPVEPAPVEDIVQDAPPMEQSEIEPSYHVMPEVVDRLEAAADRAAQAAGVAERESAAATDSADQATRALEQVIAEY